MLFPCFGRRVFHWIHWMVIIQELRWTTRDLHYRPHHKTKNNAPKGGKNGHKGGEREHIHTSIDNVVVVEEIVKMERRIFPKHESLALSFYQELTKRNCGLLYALCAGAESRQQEDVTSSSAHSDNLVAGYVMYSRSSCLVGSINKLAVRESCRRQGYGEALLRAAIEKCRTQNIQRVTLHVDPLRTAAVSLYRKLGFRIDALVHSYYSEDRHAYRMFIDFQA